MPTGDALSAFPRAIPHSTARPELTYRVVPGLFAVHGPLPDRLKAQLWLELEEGRMFVCRGDPEGALEAAPGATVVPVYALQPGGAPAVPTGRVFVRFAEGVRAEDRREEIERAGYRVVETVPYAPQAVWVESADGSIAAGLSCTPRLETLRDAVNVEPEILSKRVTR